MESSLCQKTITNGGGVNIKDEVILDFDYSSAEMLSLGNNYLMKDGSEYLIVKKGEKEDVLASFYAYGDNTNASDYATYISTKHIVNKIMETIEEYEQPRTAAQLGEAFSLSASNYGWSSEITRTVAIDDGISLTVSIQFYDIAMAREKTHTERVSYGYYSYNRTVSDGWVWTNNLPYEITTSLSKHNEVDAAAVYNMLKAQLAQGRNKVSAENDHSFYKNVKYNGNETKTYTYLSKENDVVSFTINYGDYNESYNYVEDVIEEVVDSI